jgi:hypothetical protein
LVRLYPRHWRDRYGPELQDLLESESGGVRILFDVARAAASQRIISLQRIGEGHMQAYPASVVTMVRRPSAFLPILMSLCALALVLVAVAVNGVQREPDEGAAAHIWQLLMAGQLPILAFFAFKWLARDRKAGLAILALQLIGFAAASLPVWLLGL